MQLDVTLRVIDEDFRLDPDFRQAHGKRPGARDFLERLRQGFTLLLGQQPRQRFTMRGNGSRALLNVGRAV